MFRSQITASSAWWYAECLGLRSLHLRHGGMRYVKVSAHFIFGMVVCGMFRSQITSFSAWWFAVCLGLISLHLRHGGLRYV